MRAACLHELQGCFRTGFSSKLSHKPQQCRFCSGPLVLWDQSEIILGENKSQKKLKKTGCVEVKKKAEISHRGRTGGGSFPRFERTPELKLFAQADSHHLSRWSRWTILLLAGEGRPGLRRTSDRLETLPAWSGVVCPSAGLVKVVRGGGGQDVSRCR